MTTGRTVLPSWVSPLAITLGGLVGAAVLMVSGFELYSLARNVGYSWPVSAAVPVGLDLGAAAAALVWVAGPDGGPLVSWGRMVAILSVAASAVLNGLSVLVAHQLVPAWGRVTVAVAVGLLFPLVAAAMVHLLLLLRAVPVAAPRARPMTPPAAPAPRESAARKAGTGAVLPAPVPATPTAPPDVPRALRPVPAPAPAVPAAVPAGREPTKQERAEQEWKREYRQGRAMSPAEINRAVGANGLVKGKHLDQWREEVDAEQKAQTR